MVLTRAQLQQLFEQEANRLRDIELEVPHHSEFSIDYIVYRPTFVTKMKGQLLNTINKEQIKTLGKFGGAAHEDVIKWLEEVEENFDRAQVQPPNKYLVVQWYLTDAAAEWFRYNKSNIPDWSTFKLELVKAYQLSLNQILCKLEQRQQLHGESVIDYYYDKIQLCCQADPNMSSAMIIHYLTKGLQHSLVGHVIRRHQSTPADFLNMAQDEEKIQVTLSGLSHPSQLHLIIISVKMIRLMIWLHLYNGQIIITHVLSIHPFPHPLQLHL